MAKDPILPGSRKLPKKTQGHSQAESIKHLKHRLEHLERDVEKLMSVAADLAASVAALEKTIADFPAPAPQLITQAELDDATSRVTAATAALAAKTPPTP